MESREWGATAIEVQGQGDEEDAVWESCETWTPMAADHALQAIESAHDAARAAEWSSAYHKDFEARVTDGFDRFRALLGRFVDQQRFTRAGGTLSSYEIASGSTTAPAAAAAQGTRLPTAAQICLRRGRVHNVSQSSLEVGGSR